jgi:hypothetical protein
LSDEQHLQPEDYPARREFCKWLLNLEENNLNLFLGFCFLMNQFLAFQERFYINLWTGLLGNSVGCLQQKLVYMSANFPVWVGPFEFPARLAGDIYAKFLNTELPNLLEDMPLLFYANGWFQHDGAPPHFS